MRKEHDATGRTKRQSTINGDFVPRTRSLLESPIWLAMTVSEFRLLQRIEIEHLAHGRQENGRLPVTYKDFEDYGVHTDAIASGFAR